MSTITENTYKEKEINRSITSFFKEQEIGRKLKESNAYKSKGIPIIEIIQYLVQLVYTKKSMYMDMLRGEQSKKFSKDTVYRVLNAIYINWSSFLMKLALPITKQLNDTTNKKR